MAFVLAPLPVTNRTMMGNLSGEIALWPMTTRFGNIPEAGGDIGSESQCGKPVSDLKSSRSQPQLHPSSRGASQARRDASWQAPRSVGKRKGLPSYSRGTGIGKRYAGAPAWHQERTSGTANLWHCGRTQWQPWPAHNGPGWQRKVVICIRLHPVRKVRSRLRGCKHCRERPGTAAN